MHDHHVNGRQERETEPRILGHAETSEGDWIVTRDLWELTALDYTRSRDLNDFDERRS